MSWSKTIMGRPWAGVFLSLGLLCASNSFANDGPADALRPSFSRQLVFEADIVPILKAYCWKCHGGEGLSAGLDLRTFPLALQGGKSGAALVRGSAARSLLYQHLDSGKMPPGNVLKPTEEHLAILRDWLDAGAPANYEGESLPPHVVTEIDREWWAFVPPKHALAPQIQHPELATNPIDPFLLKRLEDKGLTFSPPADRAAWIRRVSLDLLGLPPQPAEVDDFLHDASPDAHERLIDRLLASPHYGERWGRHWLDAAGYVDTIATDNDAGIIEERERIWQYRDYVIRACNADLPFDRFLLEQLAGDELFDWKSPTHYSPADRDLLIATGFLRQAADVTYAPELNTGDIRHQVVYDTVQILASNLLGLTVHCAQCHDHKFDPISQAEYYQLAAFVTPAYDPQNWKHSKDRHLFDVTPWEQSAIDLHNAEVNPLIKELQQQIARARAPFRQKIFDEKLTKLPEPVRADTKSALETPKDKRSDVQKYLAEKFGPQLAVSEPEIDAALDLPTKTAAAQWHRQIGSLSQTLKTYGKLQAVWNVGAARTYLHRRGDYQMPGPEVHFAVPVVLDNPAAPFAFAPENPRTALARWLTRPDHPLTGRVFVNRMWQHTFGRGIVATPDNFGASGAMPTHPELLDWLATEFVRRDWSVKAMHRLLMSSNAYQQTSHSPASTVKTTADPTALDPENLLLWRMPLRRLDSEIVRDNLLAVSGAGDVTMYGPPLPLKPFPDGHVEIDIAKLGPAASPNRRSLYLFCRRNYQLTELSVFDQPTVAHNCTRRISTAVVSQSLAMLNSGFAFDQAERFAKRVRETAPGDRECWITAAYRLALGRSPDAEEMAAALVFLEEQTNRIAVHMPPDQAAAAALENFCQMLLNTNEFLYVP